MNILNIFNNLVTLSTLHSPTHSQTKQPQCSCKYNMYQHVAPTSQDNPPMSAASEESTADFLPKAPQAGKKGGRATETGGRNGRQDRGGRNGAAETGRQKRGGRKQMPENGLKAPAAGERHRKSRTRTPQNRKRTGITRNWTRKSENRQGKPGNWQRSRMPKRPAFRKRSGSGRDKTKKRKLGIKTDRPSSTVSSPT